jgi:serine/threonine protein phosphatase PrpC
MAVFFAMRSDPGLVRTINEDSCGASPERGVFVVCDGMGGAASGEIASALARDSFLASFSSKSTSLAPPRAQLCEAIRAANQAVHRLAQRTRAHRGMGTTLVSLLFAASSNDVALIAHVGDSRCYRLREGQLELLTRDHSLIEEQIQAGLITPQEAAASPIRNIITRAIGTYATVDPEVSAHPVQRGDIFLLASDGLTRELEDHQIAAHLRLLGRAENPQSLLESTCQTLIDAANAHGGNDNITVALVAFR